MRIAFISRKKLDKMEWSGTAYSIYNNLLINNIDVVKIDNLNDFLRKIFILKREFFKFFKKIKYDERYNHFVSKNFSKQINKKLKKMNNVDVILTYDFYLIAHLETKIPIILWSDASYKSYYNLYFEKQKIHEKTIVDIKLIEELAFRRSKKIFFSSKWAIEDAKKFYPEFEKKFQLLPFGPNFSFEQKKDLVWEKIEERKLEKLKLITIGVDWKRKGIDKAILLTESLINMGVDTELTIIGSALRKNINKPYLKIYNSINKSKSNGEEMISKLFFDSHFNVLFSEAEAFGVVLVEANMHGIPNIAFNVGGISEIVKNNVSGHLFDKNCDIDLIIKYILDLKNNLAKYRKLCFSSYDNYENFHKYSAIIKKLASNI